MSKYFFTPYLKESSIHKNFKDNNFIKYFNFLLFLLGILYIDFYYKNKNFIEEIKIENNQNKIENNFSDKNIKNKSVVLSFLSPIDEEDIKIFIKEMKEETDSINKNISINLKKNKFNITTNIIIENIQTNDELKFVLDKIHHDENILIEIV
jgi:hypothetical protein